MRLQSRDRIPHRSEYQEQRMVMQWAAIAANQMPELSMLVHVANEGKRSAIAGRRLKEIGMRPGFPDLFLFVPRGLFYGLAIELKTDTGKVSDIQQHWIDSLQDQGYRAVVCRGAEQAIDVILRYMRLNHDRPGISGLPAAVLPDASG